MNTELILDIVKAVKEASCTDGVFVEARVGEDKFRTAPRGMKFWDIELSYSGYNYIERFNNSMSITKGDVNKVAVCLLKDLFTDYFSAKLGLAT